MFQTAILASGSRGNSILIRTSSTKILLDAGLSGRRISETIRNIGLEEKKINALIVSHEHNDHVGGAGIACRKYRIPLFITEPTYKLVETRLGRLISGVEFFHSGEQFTIGDIIITPFSSSHDVVDGCNFTFEKVGDRSRKLAVATDLGFSSRLLVTKLRNASTIILESNHDDEMLLRGPYPFLLKQRVKSRHGHLSNEQAVAVISQIIHPGLKNLVLAHLSEQNNTPEIARRVMESYLKEINYELNLFISLQNEPTPILDI
ncbi:MAG: MBL fold metallo-hydrolase [Candidatus Cloacimonas sp. SDB]|nr:MAG: MBL fold metallo-hydrolase [Candidatus Cloacimonas sp. SDB]